MINMDMTLPYLLSGVAILVAALFHWKLKQSYWKAVLLSSAATIVIALVSALLFGNNYYGLDDQGTSLSGLLIMVLIIAGFTAFYGLIISLLVGYLIKIVRSFK